MNGLEVRLVCGGVWVRAGNHAVLIDAPGGVAAALGADLAALTAVVLTSGRARAIGGLPELLEAVAAVRDPSTPLELHVPLGEERGAALADFWVHHWPNRFPLVVDAERPGAAFDAGPMRVTSLPLRAGEPNWTEQRVVPRVGIGVAVSCGAERVVVLLGAAPEPSLQSYAANADLLVVEVGVSPWPRSEVPWRLRADEAVALGRTATEVWIVGDDGRQLDPTLA